MTASIAKSGTNRLEFTTECFNDMHCGTINVTTQAVAISAVQVPCFQVLVQADPDNGGSILVGNHLQGCTIRLVAGSAITVPINDVEKIMGRAVAGTQRINWMAMK